MLILLSSVFWFPFFEEQGHPFIVRHLSWRDTRPPAPSPCFLNDDVLTVRAKKEINMEKKKYVAHDSMSDSDTGLKEEDTWRRARDDCSF